MESNDMDTPESHHDAHAEERPTKRQRKAKSCEQCRERKVKCDLNRPCGPCTIGRQKLACSYRDGDVSSGQKAADTRLLSSRDRTADAQEIPNGVHSVGNMQTNHLDEDIRQVECRPSPGDCHRSRELSADATAILRNLAERVSHLEKQLAASNGVTEAGGTRIPAFPPRLRVQPHKAKAFSPSHWVHVLDKFVITGNFELEPEYFHEKFNLARTFHEAIDIRSQIKMDQSVKCGDPVPNVVATVPSRDVCDQMIGAYLRTLEPIYRIVHIPSFQAEYNDFWNRPTASSTVFLKKMTLMMAIGTVFLLDRDDLEMLRRLGQVWIWSAQWWLMGPSEKGAINMDGLQVFCLLILARHTNPINASTIFSSDALLRLAVAQGMHRDPDHFPSLSTFQAQMRRRLWVTVVELTIQSSLDTSAPIFLSLDDFDTKPPLNLDDEDISPQSTSRTAVETKPPHCTTDSSTQILLAKSLPVRLQLVRTINRLGHHPCFEEALKPYQQIKSACVEATAFFDAEAAASRHSIFQRKFFSTYFQRCVTHLLRPFMIHAARDPRLQFARTACLEACLVSISLIADMNLKTQPLSELDDFARLVILSAGFLSGPLNLDISVTLSLELHLQLEEQGKWLASTGTGDKDRQPPSLTLSAQSSRGVAKPAPRPAPLTSYYTARCQPIKSALQHIVDISFGTISRLGIPRLKRFVFASTMLAQAEAVTSSSVATTTAEVSKAVISEIKISVGLGIAALKAANKRERDNVEGLANEVQEAISPSARWTPGTFSALHQQVLAGQDPMVSGCTMNLGVPPDVSMDMAMESLMTNEDLGQNILDFNSIMSGMFWLPVDNNGYF